MTRKRRNNNSGGSQNNSNGGHQIINSDHKDQNCDQWSTNGVTDCAGNVDGGGGNRNSRRASSWRAAGGYRGRGGYRGGGGSNRGAGGKTKFAKFADYDNRNREHEYWGHGNENGVWSRSANNNQNYAGVFGGTSNLYNHTEERHGNNNELSATQPICQGGNVAGNSQQLSQSNMENKSQNPIQTQSVAKNQLNNEIQGDIEKDSRSTSNSTNVTGAQKIVPTEEKPKLLINIKQEKHVTKLKTERKSSSSSSSDSSSSEDEQLKSNKTSVAVTTAMVNPLASPMAIKLKPSTAVATTTTNTTSPTSTLPKKPMAAASPTSTLPKNPMAAASPTPSSLSSSSSSSSSSESEVEQHPQPQPPSDKEMHKAKKSVQVSEDDVVCLGLLENKIVLEDDEEEQLDKSSKPTKSQKKGKKFNKKSVDNCMICDKKGHTSFQCQMICKNCSAPYHGYRTCPHPANLNTMLLTFMEFSMQQLQNFQPDSQFTNWFSANEANSTSVSFPQPLVDSPASKSLGKARKRKAQVKAKDSRTTSKKRKTSTKKQASDSDDDDDDDDSDSTTQSEDSSTNSSSEGFETQSTSKNKKSKAKHKSRDEFNMHSFMPNSSINCPLSLNGLSNIATASTNPQINTMLLTQMFQNAISSLSNQKRS